MSNALSDMNLTPDELEQSDKSAGWNLSVPPKAEAGRKKGVARWLEFVKVKDAYRTSEAGKEGQDRMVANLEYKVIAGGDNPENEGRAGTIFLRLNPGVAKGRTDTLGQGDAKKENIMHSMAMKKIKQMMVAVGLPLTQGLTAETFDALFPEGSESQNGILIGRNLAFQMKDDASRKSPAGENNQEPENILTAPEGV